MSDLTIPDEAKRAFAGRGPNREGEYALDSRRNPWVALEAAAPFLRRQGAIHELDRLAEELRRTARGSARGETYYEDAAEVLEARARELRGEQR